MGKTRIFRKGYEEIGSAREGRQPLSHIPPPLLAGEGDKGGEVEDEEERILELIEKMWQYILVNKDTFVIGIIVTAFVTIVFFLFRNIFTKIWELVFQNTEKKRLQDEKLHEHFRDIKKEALVIVTLCSSVSEWYGALLLNQKPETLVSMSHYVSKFGAALLPLPLPSFAAHFPEESSKLSKYRTYIEDHNRRRFALDASIKQDFESKNISVLNVNETSKRPFCIYDNIYQPLFQCWQDRNKQKPNNWINFNNIGVKANESPNNLYVEGWGGQAIAFAKTDSGKNKCKRAIREVANNTRYQQDVGYLTLSSLRLTTEIADIAQQLADKLGNVDKFWPGTKIYKFKIEKKRCWKCKEIFG